MKFNFGLTRTERMASKEEWHDWFAWRPVAVGSHDWRWMEKVDRKGEYSVGCASGFVHWDWEYCKK